MLPHPKSMSAKSGDPGQLLAPAEDGELHPPDANTSAVATMAALAAELASPISLKIIGFTSRATKSPLLSVSY
jgi:hypothetical protein